MTSTDSFNIGGSALDGLDRRSGARRPLRVNVKVTVAGHLLGARTIDIAAHGLSIAIDRNLPMRTDCRVAFTLPVNGQGHPLDLHARVVHGVLSGHEGFKLGLELLETSVEEDQWIEQYVAR